MFRAICGRIEQTLQGLPPPYLLNRPLMLLTTSSESRYPAKAPSFSVNWAIGHELPEIVNTTTGKTEMGSSRLCKQHLSKRFSTICELSKAALPDHEFKMPPLYSEAKELANTYNVRIF